MRLTNTQEKILSLLREEGGRLASGVIQEKLGKENKSLVIDAWEEGALNEAVTTLHSNNYVGLDYDHETKEFTVFIDDETHKRPGKDPGIPQGRGSR